MSNLNDSEENEKQFGEKIRNFFGMPAGKALVVVLIIIALSLIFDIKAKLIGEIAIALVVFSVIVVVHELGHFLLAKKNGIGVTDFSIGMGPKIWSFKKGETTYSLRWLPLGGSCMMVGEDQELEQDNAFNKKGVWARISVIAAGPIFNFILAFVFALVVVSYAGWDYAKIKVVKGMPAMEQGLKDGDIIKSINGTPILNMRDLSNELMQFNPIKSEDTLHVKVKRDGKTVNYDINPQFISTYVIDGVEYEDGKAITIKSLIKDSPLDKAGLKKGDKIVGIDGTVVKTLEELNDYLTDNELGKNVQIEYIREAETKEAVKIQLKEKSESYMLGIYFNQYPREKDINALQVVGYSGVEVGYWIKTTIQSLGYLFAGKASTKDVSGPVGIVNIIGDSYEEAYKDGGPSLAIITMLYVSILLSANIGVMNLLPFPALDGGRLMFLFLEAIRRKPVKPELEGMVHAIGLVLLMILMVFVLFNDIVNLFH